jgi:hypothetical protein
MPRVTLRAPESADSKEDTVSEYICDMPDCPNVAVHVVGVVRELRTVVAVCAYHARWPSVRSADAGS